MFWRLTCPKMRHGEARRTLGMLREFLPFPIFITRGTEQYQMNEGMQQRINEITQKHASCALISGLCNQNKIKVIRPKIKTLNVLYNNNRKQRL